MTLMDSDLEVFEQRGHSIPEYYKPLPEPPRLPDQDHGYGENSNTFLTGNETLEENFKQLRGGRIQRVLRLRPGLLAIIVAILTTIIVTTIVGGGLGAALANARSHKASEDSLGTNISTSANSGPFQNYRVPDQASIASVFLDCPSIDDQIKTTTNGQTWALSCKHSQESGTIAAILAYKYEDCLEACAAMNYWQKNSTACASLQFWPSIATVSTGQNCWLKDNSSYPKPLEVGVKGLSANLIEGGTN